MLSIVLEAKGWAHLTDWAFVIPSLGAIVSPLFLGALADQRINAERVLAGVMAMNATCTALAFWFLGRGDSEAWFLFFLVAKALLGAPSWSLLMSITLTHLSSPERQFGRVRVWGTVGWMAAGWSISWLSLDQSPLTGLVASSLGWMAAGCCFLLPATPPSGLPSRDLLDSLGLRAFRVLRDRDTGVYFLTAFLFSIPLAAYYPYSAKFLKSLGVDNVATLLSFGQVTEIVAMLLMGLIFRKLRLKWIFVIALSAGFLRYLFYLLPAYSGGHLHWMIAGMLMHGICWTLFFEAGRLFVDKRVDTAMRSQAQALLTVWTTGVASIIGIFFAGGLFRWCMAEGGMGWNGFWSVLSGLCFLSLLVFAIGYRGSGARLNSCQARPQVQPGE